MIRLPKPGPIEYLVSRKFPAYRAIEGSLLPSSSDGGLTFEQREKELREVSAYEAELRAKPADELNALVKQEKEKERREQQAREEREERQRIFNQPHAKADFEHWSKAAYWDLDEAIALAFGKAPEVVNWREVHQYTRISPFAIKYARVRDLILRATAMCELDDRIEPGIFLAWAKKKEIDVPRELIDQVEARAMLAADWKDAWEGFDETADTYPKELDIALQAWRAVSERRDFSKTVKEQVENWVKEHYPDLSDEAKQRIATVCNWEKKGGRKKRS